MIAPNTSTCHHAAPCNANGTRVKRINSATASAVASERNATAVNTFVP